MSAYRSAPLPEKKQKEDVRRLSIAPLGVFGTVVWGTFILVGGAVVAGMLSYTSKEGLGLRNGAAIGGATLGLAILVAVCIFLFEIRLTIIARIEAGTLSLEERRGLGAKHV